MSAAFKSRTEPSDFLERSGPMFPSRHARVLEMAVSVGDPEENPGLDAVLAEEQACHARIIAENAKPREAWELECHRLSNFQTAESCRLQEQIDEMREVLRETHRTVATKHEHRIAYLETRGEEQREYLENLQSRVRTLALNHKHEFVALREILLPALEFCGEPDTRNAIAEALSIVQSRIDATEKAA